MGRGNLGTTFQTAQNQSQKAEIFDESHAFHVLEILNDAVQSEWFL
jgi:hypothetical protein